MVQTATYKEKAKARKEAERFNTNVTAHLFSRMVMNPENKQYKADYDNRRSQFKDLVY
jgi:hypothetical protein